MRICFISTFYPPAIVDGATRYMQDFTEILAKKGIDVEVVTLSSKKKQVTRKGRLRIHRLPFMNPQDKKNPKTKAIKLLNYLKKLEETRGIDVISSQALHLWGGTSPPLYSLASNLFSLNYNIPNILTSHSHMLRDMDKIPTQYLLWDKIISVSNSVSEEMHSLGIEFDKITTCYPGVDIEKFKPGLGKGWLRSRIDAKENDIILLFAGRIIDISKEDEFEISSAKGLPTLLKAFSIVSQKKRNVKLLIAAARPFPEQMERFEKVIKKIYEKAELLGFKNKIIVKPFELEEMPRVYNGSDIFVMPSQGEGFGLVYAEAMACQIPVIGASVGGVPEIITNGEDGYLLEPDKPTELAKRLEWLIKDEKRREIMGKKGREKITQKFDLNKMAEKLIGVFNSVLEKQPKKKLSSYTNKLFQFL